jgi:hypothetical protein
VWLGWPLRYSAAFECISCRVTTVVPRSIALDQSPIAQGLPLFEATAIAVTLFMSWRIVLLPAERRDDSTQLNLASDAPWFAASHPQYG